VRTMVPGWRFGLGEKEKMVSFPSRTCDREHVNMLLDDKSRLTSFPLAIDGRECRERSEKNKDICKGKDEALPVYLNHDAETGGAEAGWRMVKSIGRRRRLPDN
jgi:hypothetical protein